jgi:hypothetical protein
MFLCMLSSWHRQSWYLALEKAQATHNALKFTIPMNVEPVNQDAQLRAGLTKMYFLVLSVLCYGRARSVAVHTRGVAATEILN